MFSYKSGWFTVGIPTLTFLTVWFASSLLTLALLDWNVSDWVGMLICAGGILPGFIVSVLSYPLLLRLAERGRGEISLEGTLLRYRLGSRWRKIDLAQPHSAQIAADSNCAGLVLQTGKAGVNIYFHRFSRRMVLDIFPAPYFVEELVVTPSMGSWGFEMTVDDPTQSGLARALLETLWRQRQKNRLFLLYEKFPWDHSPQPDSPYIRLIEWEKRSAEDEALIKRLEQQFIDGLTTSYVRLTPDYLLGWVYRSVRSHWTGQPDYYCLMPLGYISAEISLPRPDWEPFIIGHVLKEALAAALKTTAPAGGPYLEHRRYLYIRGRSADGAPMEFAFDWYNPGDEGYDEAQFLVLFVSVMKQRHPSGA